MPGAFFMIYYKAMLSRRVAILSLLLAAVLLPTAASAARGVVYWPLFQIPPLFILGDDGCEGYGPDIQALLQKALPEYEHRTVAASIKRQFTDAKREQRLVLVGPVESGERSGLVYSDLPCAFTMAAQIVIRKEDTPRLAPTGVFPVRRALADPKLTWGCPEGIHLHDLQAVLGPYLDSPGALLQGGVEPLLVLFRMLAAGRLDWIVCSPVSVPHYADALGIAARIAVVPPLEAPAQPLLARVACPDTQWGRATIKRLDAALAEEIRTGRYVHILSPWVPPSLRAEFRRVYEKRFLGPALRMNP